MGGGDGDGEDLEVDSCWMTSEMKEDDRVMQVREGLHCGAGGGANLITILEHVRPTGEAV